MSVNYLNRAILSGPINRNPQIDPHRNIRRGLIGSETFVSLVANGSFIPIIARFSGVASAGDCISFMALDSWAILDGSEEAFGAGTKEELKLLKRNSMTIGNKVVLTTASVALAIFGRSSAALPALDYNGSLGVPSMIFLYLQGAILSTRSMQMSIDKVMQFQRFRVDDYAKRIEASRQEMVGEVDKYLSHFGRMDAAGKLVEIAKFSVIRSKHDAFKVRDFLKAVYLRPQPVVMDRGKCMKAAAVAGNILTKGAGIFASSVLQTAVILYTFSKTEEYMVENPIGAGILTAISVGPGLYLTTKSIIETTDRLAGAFFAEKTIAEQLEPELTGCLKFIGLTFNVCTYGSTYVIWGDFFKGSDSRDLFVYTGGSALFLLTATATLSLVEGTVEKIVLKKGEVDKKNIIKLTRDLKRLKYLMEKSSLLDYSLFLLDLPEAIKTKVLEKVDLSSQKLESYIERRWPSEIISIEMTTLL